MKLRKLILASLISITLCGCNLLPNSNTEITQQKLDASIEKYKESLIMALTTGEVNEFFIEDLYIYEEDLVSTPEIKQYYSSNNTIYLQINDKYMYRFQLNNATGLIESYIKYNLEE